MLVLLAAFAGCRTPRAAREASGRQAVKAAHDTAASGSLVQRLPRLPASASVNPVALVNAGMPANSASSANSDVELTVFRHSRPRSTARFIAGQADKLQTDTLQTGSAKSEASQELAAPVLAAPALAARRGPANALPVTLDNAIAVSLDRNPDLITLRASQPVASAVYRVSEVYPWNPFVQVHVLPYARDKAGNTLAVQHYVWLMQTIELAHQQQHREASARAALNQVRWNIVQAELANSAMAERLYFTALYQRALRDLAQRTLELNQELQGVVERRFKAGLALAADQTTARVAVRQSRRQAELAQANYRTALLALRRQLNPPAHESIALVGQLADFTWLPVAAIQSPEGRASDPWSAAIAQGQAEELAGRRPDVLAARFGVGVARANTDLARANQVQNVAIGPFYERDETGTVLAGFRGQMNLPVWDNGRPLTAQRTAEQNLQWATFNQLRARARVEARTAIERYERARSILETEGVGRGAPIAEELRNIKDQFASGQADILNVYTVQNSLLQEQRADLDLLNEVAQAAADVTLMAGLPPARVVTARREEPPQPQLLPMP